MTTKKATRIEEIKRIDNLRFEYTVDGQTGYLSFRSAEDADAHALRAKAIGVSVVEGRK